MDHKRANAKLPRLDCKRQEEEWLDTKRSSRRILETVGGSDKAGESTWGQRLQLEMLVTLDGGTIRHTQRFVDSVATRLLSDADAGWRIGMATHELLDNARAYGGGEPARLQLRIEPAGGGYRASLFVRNRSDEVHATELRSAIELLSESANADALYERSMERLAQSEMGSGLGLVRVTAEGGFALSASNEEYGYVGVCAELTVGVVR